MNDSVTSTSSEARQARKERSARYHRLISLDTAVLSTPDLNAMLSGELPLPKEFS